MSVHATRARHAEGPAQAQVFLHRVDSIYRTCRTRRRHRRRGVSDPPEQGWGRFPRQRGGSLTPQTPLAGPQSGGKERRRTRLRRRLARGSIFMTVRTLRLIGTLGAGMTLVREGCCDMCQEGSRKPPSLLAPLSAPFEGLR